MVFTGPDVSRWQGKVDWPEVAGAGHVFAWCKATQGVSWVDPQFDANRRGIPAAGLVPGAYHFLDHETDAAAQARHFVRTVGDAAGIMAALDVESEGSGNPTIDQAEAFAAEFRRLAPGHPLVIYTSWGWWSPRDRSGRGASISPYLWHARYRPVASGPGDMYGGWSAPTFWQHTSSGSCPGIRGDCDLNLFYGERSLLRHLAGAAGATRPEEDPLAPYSKEDLIDAAQRAIRREFRSPVDKTQTPRQAVLELATRGGLAALRQEFATSYSTVRSELRQIVAMGASDTEIEEKLDELIAAYAAHEPGQAPPDPGPEPA